MNRTKRTIITAAGIAAPALAGCGTAASPSSPSTASSPASTAPAAPASPASQLGPGDIPVMQTVREGQSFTLTGLENNLPSSWRVTLASIRCGSGAIFDPKVIAAGQQNANGSANPQPPAGMKFCLVKFAVVNQGHSNQPWSADQATVNVGQDAYQYDNGSPGFDVAQDYWNYAQPQSQDSDFGLQPGASGVSWAVYSIPQAAKVTSVSVPAGSSIADSAQVLITLAGS